MTQPSEYGGGPPAPQQTNGLAHGSGSPIPTAATAAPGQSSKPEYEPHPLFMDDLADGQLEHRDIQLLRFFRKGPGGKLISQPDIIPAKQVKSWAEVAGWWGGGYYCVTARNAHGHFAGRFPAGEELHFLDGPEKPFLPLAQLHAASSPAAAAPQPTGPTQSAPAPELTALDRLAGIVADLAGEVRAQRAQPTSGNSEIATVMQTMMQFSATQSLEQQKIRAEDERARLAREEKAETARLDRENKLEIARLNAPKDNTKDPTTIMWGVFAKMLEKGGQSGGGTDVLDVLERGKNLGIMGGAQDPMVTLATTAMTMFKNDAGPQAAPPPPERPREREPQERPRPRGPLLHHEGAIYEKVADAPTLAAPPAPATSVAPAPSPAQAPIVEPPAPAPAPQTPAVAAPAPAPPDPPPAPDQAPADSEIHERRAYLIEQFHRARGMPLEDRVRFLQKMPICDTLEKAQALAPQMDALGEEFPAFLASLGTLELRVLAEAVKEAVAPHGGS